MSTISIKVNNQGFSPVPPLWVLCCAALRARNENAAKPTLPTPRPDANAQQSRIPINTEMATLKRMSESNAKATRMLDEEIKQLRKTYEVTHKQYNQRKVVLEATKLDLDRIQSLISATEAQQALRESEQRDILALMYPVRRCPNTVLREIFEYIAHETNDRRLALRGSVRLSSVCQKWREVAISTPLLWTKVSFNLRNPPRVVKHQQETIVSRIKGRAADIQVRNIDYTSSLYGYINHLLGERLDACGLTNFPRIDNLSLLLTRPEGILQLVRPEFLFPTGHIYRVHIESAEPRSKTRAPEHPIVLGSSLLNQFPGITSVIVDGLFCATFQLTHVNSTLTQLTIDNAKLVFITTILSGCPQLDILKIRNATIQGSSIPVAPMSLRTLELDDIEGDTWMTHTIFPKLETLALLTKSTRASLALISSNRSIKTLFCRNPPSDIINIAPQLINLHVSPSLQALYAPFSPSQVALPSLMRLFVNLTCPNHVITMQEFDMLVRTRCLHSDHPKSLAMPSSQVLASLTFAVSDTSTPPEWHKSELYKDSIRSESTHPFYDGKVTHLTW